MALGYSASSATTTYPSSWYTGRLTTDPLGTMPQGEGSIINGTGSLTSGGNRWGDYTSIHVDPVDDCTFWYVNEYLPTNGTNWRLRIGAFKFNECSSPTAVTLASIEASQMPAPVPASLPVGVCPSRPAWPWLPSTPCVGVARLVSCPEGLETLRDDA